MSQHRATEPSPATTPAGAVPAARKLTLLQLIAATYFMVAGGPYGLEDLVQTSGYWPAALVLVLTPILWSLPTALMVGELSSAIPEEGGYYAWVRRALGPFWGFQEAWLSLAASIFDMALYPTLFVLYLSRLWPVLGEGQLGWALGLAMLAACALANILGARAVGGSSLVMGVVLLGPFVVLTVLALAQRQVPVAGGTSFGTFDFLGGMAVAMWNCMGWDNASTVAGEVERPQRTYPLAMIASVALVTATYVVPVLAAARTGIDPSDWETGSWVTVAEAVGGSMLGVAVVVGGVVGAFGSCNALVMSYSRLPVVLAEDGYLPALFTRRQPRTGAPWVAISACAVGWALALQLGFSRLVALDVLLYGLSLVLEFIALFALRISEPGLHRPFRVPGGTLVAGLLGVGPVVLLGLEFFRERGEKVGPMPSLLLGAILVALGPILYLASGWLRKPAQGNGLKWPPD